VSSGGPIEGKQEGESPAFRAGKGQAFPACEPRKGHCGSVGAEGQWGSLHEIEISLTIQGVTSIHHVTPRELRWIIIYEILREDTKLVCTGFTDCKARSEEEKPFGAQQKQQQLD